MKFSIYLIFFLSYLLFKYLNKKESKPPIVSPKTPPFYPEEILNPSRIKGKASSLHQTKRKEAIIPFEEGKTNAEPVYEREETDEEKAFKSRETASIYAIEEAVDSNEFHRPLLNIREAFIASVIIQRPY
jgi:hypothetical protein